MPNFYIIAGCNGAGKTTASFTILPSILNCKEFVNADEIAKGLSPFQPETVSFQAGRIMLERINELILSRVDFAIETTLTTLSYQLLVKKAMEKGYQVSMVFFYLNDVNLAIKRVEQRVHLGGHDIPKDVIIRRYYRGIKNLVNVFVNLCHNWTVVDNSSKDHSIIAEGSNKNYKIIDSKVWNNLKYIANNSQ